jgi:hypothetical protein
MLAYTPVIKKRLNFLNSVPTSIEGALFKKFSVFEHEEIQENAIRELRTITESVFQTAFKQQKKWEQCSASRGDYFEGDSA